MWKPLIFFYAFVALQIHGQELQTGQTREQDVLVTMPINIDGSLRNLELLRGETYEDAATSFARKNGLFQNDNQEKVRDVIAQLSSLLKDRMAELEQPVTETKNAQQQQQVIQLQIPLTINGFTSDLIKYEGESVETAAERFLMASGFTMDVMRELYPQIVDIVNQKLNELQPPRKELFSFGLNLDGQEITVRHFEQGDPLAEATETLREVGIVDADLVGRIAPQIANAITQRNNEFNAQAAQQPAQEQQQQQMSNERELFSMPLTLNNREAVLVHYEGYTSRETAVRFLQENGVTDPNDATKFLPQLIQFIDDQVAELASQTVEAESVEQVAPERTPIVRLPINLGNNQEAILEYFEGDSVDRTVELFLDQIGLERGELFTQNANQLADLLRQELKQNLAARDQPESTSAKKPEPLFVLPINLGEKVFNLEYFTGQEPSYAANTFCVESYEAIRAELGKEFNGNQVQECKVVLTNKINEMISSTETATPEQNEAETANIAAEEVAKESRELLFTMDIEVGEDETVPLSVYQGDDPVQVATKFCQQYNIDEANVPMLVEAIQGQM